MIAFALFACLPDDYTGEGLTPLGDTSSAPTASTEPDGEMTIVGEWLSEGADLSELFSADPFAYASVTAVFRADGTFLVTAVDGQGTEYPLEGDFTVGTTTMPATIAIVQTEPYAAEASGIWEVAGDTLTYEVVQTTPDYGFGPPTPERDFGSTTGPGLAPGANVQTYQAL